jgi:cytochrome c-type biogenesis protein CcmH
VTTVTAPASPAASKRRVRRWAPWVVLAAIAVVALAIGVQRHSRPTLSQQTMSIANAVRCPVCSGETAAQSDTPASGNIRDFIRNQLQAGESRSQILAQLSASYGASILEKPSARGVDLVLWALPILAGLVAIGGLGMAFSRWRGGGGSAISEEDRALVGGALDPDVADRPGPWDES